MTQKEEDQKRLTSCRFIDLLGRHLNLNADCIALAMVYVNAYFLRRSFQDVLKKKNGALWHIAAASILVASKVNSRNRAKVKIWRIIDIAIHFLQPGVPTPDVQSQEALKFVDLVVEAECDVLTVLEFNLKIPLPHDYIESFLDVIFTDDKKVEGEKAITHQLALTFCNDCCRLGISLFSESKLVALACIQLALKFHSVDSLRCQKDAAEKGKDSMFEAPEGWLPRSSSVFTSNISTKDLRLKLDVICTRCMLVYKNSPPPRKF